eukprot:scaffold2400_cov187-Cylindrotheca_fusiformis.AAC.5
MCGRASQTLAAAHEVGEQLGVGAPKSGNVSDEGLVEGKTERDNFDNYNMCPGMNAFVIFKNDDKYEMERMSWGLLTKNGTSKKPIQTGKQRMSLQFQSLMFNARSDTLFSKPTFSKLAHQRRSCIVALDGYFEWKKSPLAGGKGKKQPYYVYHKDHGRDKKNPLLVAGLWTQVSTGIPDEPTLRTFTILTTEPCKQIAWLHDRMPLCLWDENSCLEWLDNPTSKVLKAMDITARQNEGFAWHMVSQEMSNLKFRGRKATEAIKSPPSVLSFFSAKSAAKNIGIDRAPTTTDESSKLKRERMHPAEEGPSPKKKKITAFFHAKS